METDLTTQLSIEEKADLENLEGAIKRELGSFIVVGMALAEIRVKGLYREGYKTFKDYCNQKWDMGRQYADRLIAGSQVAVNLTPRGVTMPPCETQPMFEKQVRPLVILEPNQQRDVWEMAVRTAPVGKVCHFRTPAISVSGGFSDETAETASVASGQGSGRRWAGAVAASGRVRMVPAEPWPRGKVTPAPSLGDRLRAVAGL